MSSTSRADRIAALRAKYKGGESPQEEQKTVTKRSRDEDEDVREENITDENGDIIEEVIEP